MAKIAFIKNSDSPVPKIAGITRILKSVAVAFAITVVLLLVLSALLTYTSMPDSLITVSVIFIAALSNIIAGGAASKSQQSPGWINGAVTGLIYMILLYMIGAATHGEQTYSPNLVMMFIVGLLSGAFGGIIGINIGNSRRIGAKNTYNSHRRK